MVNAIVLTFVILGCIICVWILWQLLLWIFWIFVNLTINKKKEYTQPSAFYNWAFVLWYRYMMIAGRIKLHVSGYEKVPFGKRFLLVSNHCSKFDNFIHCAVLKKTQIAYISKPENFKIPIGGRFMKRGLYLSLPRGNTRQEFQVIMKAIEYIKDDKVSIGIFPEGSRSKDGKLQDFKPGAFKIAEKAKCPILVCCMRGTFDIHKNWPWKMTLVDMDILDVIEPSVWESKNTIEVSQYAHDLILNNLNKNN
jgi:1-acyl-sn-glycerol-3-phosphate acyltransferase